MSERDECLFCGIAEGRIPADKLLETDRVVAFRDINPQAPTHVVIIPREHIPTANELRSEHATLVGELVLAARDLAERLGDAADGYRLVLNCQEQAGQSVFHVHLHLLGGRRFSWPPG